METKRLKRLKIGMTMEVALCELTRFYTKKNNDLIPIYMTLNEEMNTVWIHCVSEKHGTYTLEGGEEKIFGLDRLGKLSLASFPKLKKSMKRYNDERKRRHN